MDCLSDSSILRKVSLLLVSNSAAAKLVSEALPALQRQAILAAEAKQASGPKSLVMTRANKGKDLKRHFVGDAQPASIMTCRGLKG